MSIKEQMREDNETYGGSANSDFFKFEKTGIYRLRILTPFKALATHFFGKGVPSSVCYGELSGCPFHGTDKASVKYMTYVIDRIDGKVKMAEIPWSVVSAIGDLEQDEDFGFKDFPMPYDIKVTADKENTDPKQIYKTLGSPKVVPLTVEEDNALIAKTSKMTIESYVESRKQKQLEKHKADGTWQKEQERRIKLGEEIAAAKLIPSADALEYPAEDINPDDIPF